MTDQEKNTLTLSMPEADTKVPDSMAKEPGRWKLLICFLGIFVSYFVYGLLQEKITKGKYGEDGDKFTFTLALVFVQCIINAIFAQAVISATHPGEDTAPRKWYAVMSFSYLGAMLASNHALQYVAYPTQVLGKSVKPIPVMILGVVLAHKRYPWAKYCFVLLIVMGVALFIYKDQSKAVDHTLGFGELLLVVSLFLDGVTGGVQDKIRGEFQTQTHRMMRNMNLWSVLYLAVALTATGELFAFIVFAKQYPSVLVNLLLFSACSAIGQNFIFMTVTNFGPLTCSIITTTRKFFTILMSVIIFQNPMSSRQWLGTLLVFIGLGLDSVYGKEKKTEKKEKKAAH